MTHASATAEQVIARLQAEVVRLQAALDQAQHDLRIAHAYQQRYYALRRASRAPHLHKDQHTNPAHQTLTHHGVTRLNVAAAAAQKRCSRNTICVALRAGHLDGEKLAGTWWITDNARFKRWAPHQGRAL